jgi:hypothetical protein
MLSIPLLVPQSCPATCGGGMCLPASGTCECYAANSGPTCQDCAAGFTQVRWLVASWLAGWWRAGWQAGGELAGW